MTVIFWNGKGWLVPAVSFGVSLIAEIVSEGLTGDDNYYQAHGLAFALAMWISAAINGLVFWQHYSNLFAAQPTSRKKKRPKRKNVPGWVDHSFMFVNQGVWVIILIVSGFGVLVSRGI